jgi:hypothetical protein
MEQVKGRASVGQKKGEQRLQGEERLKSLRRDIREGQDLEIEELSYLWLGVSVTASKWFPALLKDGSDIFKQGIRTSNSAVVVEMMGGLKTKAFWVVENNNYGLLDVLISQIVGGKFDTNAASDCIAAVIQASPVDVNRELKARILGLDESVRGAVNEMHRIGMMKMLREEVKRYKKCRARYSNRNPDAVEVPQVPLTNNELFVKCAIEARDTEMFQVLMERWAEESPVVLKSNNYRMLDYLIKRSLGLDLEGTMGLNSEWKAVGSKLEEEVAVGFMASVIRVEPEGINRELESRISGMEEPVRGALRKIIDAATLEMQGGRQEQVVALDRKEVRKRVRFSEQLGQTFWYEEEDTDPEVSSEGDVGRGKKREASPEWEESESKKRRVDCVGRGSFCVEVMSWTRAHPEL